METVAKRDLEMPRLMSNKIHFKTKIIRDNEKPCIMIKESDQQEDIVIINISTKQQGSEIYEADIDRSEGETVLH